MDLPLHFLSNQTYEISDIGYAYIYVRVVQMPYP